MPERGDRSDRGNERWRRDKPTQTVFLGGLPRYTEESDVRFYVDMFLICALPVTFFGCETVVLSIGHKVSLCIERIIPGAARPGLRPCRLRPW